MSKLSMISTGATSLSIKTISTAEMQPPTARLWDRLSRIVCLVSGVTLVSLSSSLLTSSKAEAVSFAFTRIIDTTTAVPGNTVDFTSLSTLPALENGTVVFTGQSFIPDPVDPTAGTPIEGVYRSSGGAVDIVADTTTFIPGGTERFQFFGNPSFDNGNVAFTGNAISQRGIYTNIGGTLNVVANTNTPVPDGTGNFTGFASLSLSNGNIVFRGSHSSRSSYDSGIYIDVGGMLNVIADTNTPVPDGTGNLFGGFLDSAFDNGNVAFQGLQSISTGVFSSLGIYTNIHGKLNVVADINTPVPDGTGNFTQFEAPALDNESAAFFGVDSSDLSGIYTSLGSTLNVVANTNTFVPGGTGTFSSFDGSSTSFDSGNVAFIGTDAVNQSGIYTDAGGVLAEVITTGEFLDGKFVSSLNLGSEGLSGHQIAFQVTFDDDSQGIYVAQAVPEPSPALGALAFVGACLTFRKLKNSCQSSAHREL